MKQLLVIVVLACAVTRTWAGLGHVKTIDAEPMAAEATVEEAVSVKPAQLAHCLLVTGALPVVAPIARSRWNAVALPAVVPMRGDLALTGKGLPRITAARFTSMQKADPFMTDIDVWIGGPLGVLRDAALKADKQGDVPAFRNLEKRYWDGYGAAVERRRIQGQK